MTNHYYLQMNKEREIRIDTSKTLAASELSVGQLKQKLAGEESARQSADSALSILQKQVEDQGKKLKDATDQLKGSKEQFSELMKQLEEAQRQRGLAEEERDKAERARAEAEKARDEAEQRGYDEGVAETEDSFRKEVPTVCRAYCAQTWEEALNRAGVEPSSELRIPDNIFFPLAIRASGTPSQQQEVFPTAVGSSGEAQGQNLLPAGQRNQPEVYEAEGGTPLHEVTEVPKDGRASQSFKEDLASTVLPAGETLEEKEKDKDVPL